LALILGFASAGCSSGVPAASTPLGKIMRINNFAERSSALRQFVEARLADRAKLQKELTEAGFVESHFQNDQGVDCQSFWWKSTNYFPVVTLVNICGNDVFANAGQQAP